MHRPALLTALVLVLAAVLALAPRQSAAEAEPPAPASSADKSVNELRQENQRLREKVAELDAQLAEARRRIARLEETIRTLRAQPQQPDAAAGASPAPAAPAQPAASAEPLPDDPYAAPDALYAALKKDFESTVGALPRTTDQETDRYVREARRWVRQMAQRQRRVVDWQVRVLDPSARRSGEPAPAIAPSAGDATVVIVNPSTGATIGDPFRVALTARDMGRVEEGCKSGIWTLSGVFAASPTVDYPPPSQPVIFNAPRMIGPFVEFGYELNVRAIAPYVPTGEPAKD